MPGTFAISAGGTGLTGTVEWRLTLVDRLEHRQLDDCPKRRGSMSLTTGRGRTDAPHTPRWA